MPASDSCNYPEIHRRDSTAYEDQQPGHAVFTKPRNSLALLKFNQPTTETTTQKTNNLLQPMMTTATTTTTTTTTTKDALIHLDLQYLTQAFKMLESLHLWTFNIFKLNRLTNGRSLYHVTLHLFHRYDFPRTFSLDIDRLMHCVSLVESSYYYSNPYHNSVHAADVVQALFVHLSEPLLESSLDPVEKMSAILSAACHDIDHPGTNQGFLMATANPLCGLYNNVSVLENHHWRATIAILQESKLFNHLEKSTWLKIKNLVRLMILATDITQQAAILSVFREYLNGNDLGVSSDEQQRCFILQLTLKCADISNPCRPWQLSKCWSELICEEFFRQGDKEKQLGLVVTPFCDRSQSTIAKIQTGFMTHVAEPLFVEWNRFLATNNSQTMMKNLRNNMDRWESISKQDSLRSLSEKAEALPVDEGHRDVSGPTIDRSRVEISPDGSRSLVAEFKDLNLKEDKVVWTHRKNLPAGNSVSSSCQHVRRLSLPTTDCRHHPNFFSLISRLTPDFERLHSNGELERRSASKEDRGHFKDMPPSSSSSSSSVLRLNQPNQPAKSNTVCSECVGQFSPKTEECGFLQNGSPSILTGRWRVGRKMSLISPRGDQPTVTIIVGRKRSRSLVTSSIASGFEENSGWNGGCIRNWEVSPEQLVVTSAGGGLWTTWWQKKNKNNFCRTKILQSQNSDSACCPREENNIEQRIPVTMSTSSSDSLSHLTPTVQLLNRQCPALVSRVLEANFHAPKVASRKTTSTLTRPQTTEDAEDEPLLGPSDGDCKWQGES